MACKINQFCYCCSKNFPSGLRLITNSVVSSTNLLGLGNILSGDGIPNKLCSTCSFNVNKLGKSWLQKIRQTRTTRFRKIEWMNHKCWKIRSSTCCTTGSINPKCWYCSNALPFKCGKKIHEAKGRGRPKKKIVSSLSSVPNMIDSSSLTSQLTLLSLQQKVATISEAVTDLSADERIAVLKCVSEDQGCDQQLAGKILSAKFRRQKSRITDLKRTRGPPRKIALSQGTTIPTKLDFGTDFARRLQFHATVSNQKVFALIDFLNQELSTIANLPSQRAIRKDNRDYRNMYIAVEFNGEEDSDDDYVWENETGQRKGKGRRASGVFMVAKDPRSHCNDFLDLEEYILPLKLGIDSGQKLLKIIIQRSFEPTSLHKLDEQVYAPYYAAITSAKESRVSISAMLSKLQDIFVNREIILSADVKCMQLILGLSNNACPWCTMTSKIINGRPRYNLFSKEEPRTGTLAKEQLKLVKKNKHFRGQKFPPLLNITNTVKSLAIPVLHCGMGLCRQVTDPTASHISNDEFEAFVATTYKLYPCKPCC